MIFCVWILIFCLEPTVREQLNENDFRHCYGNFFEITILKLPDHSYVQSSFATITRHIDNGIWKDTLQLKILRTWIIIGSILSWLTIFKRKSTKVPGKLSFTQESEPASQRTLLQSISLIIVCFFFAGINLVFKFNLALIR